MSALLAGIVGAAVGSIDSILAEHSRSGWEIRSLAQYDHLWEARMRRSVHEGYEFGYGLADSAESAINEAVASATFFSVPVFKNHSILADLGFLPKVTRRLR